MNHGTYIASNLLASYLSGREQHVDSSKNVVDHSVPQGTVLELVYYIHI